MRKHRKIALVISVLVFSLINLSLALTEQPENSATQTTTASSSADVQYSCACNTSENGISLLSDFLFPVLIEGFGVFLALVAADYVDKREERQKTRSLNQALMEELNTIRMELNEYKPETEDYHRFVTPVWDFSLRSGAINYLTDDTYRSYRQIYAKIQYLQDVEKDWFYCKILGASESDKIKSAESTKSTYRDDVEKALQKDRVSLTGEIKEMIDKIQTGAKK